MLNIVRNLAGCITLFFCAMSLGKVTPVGMQSHIKTYYSECKRQFPDKYMQSVQEHIDEIIKTSRADEIIPIVGPISSMSSTASFKKVKNRQRQLEQLTMHSVNIQTDKIRLACLHKLVVPLIIEMHASLLYELFEIDELLSFWHYADEHHWDYYLRRNPVCWLKGSQRQLVKDKIKQLKKLKQLYSFHLGRLVIQASQFNLQAEAKVQYEWFLDLYNIMIATIPNQKLLDPQPNFESISALFGRAISTVEKFDRYAARARKIYAIPSALERYWIGGLMASTAGAGSLYGALKYSAEIGTAITSIGDLGKRFSKGMGDALWGNDQQAKKSLEEYEANVMESYEMTLLKLLPYYTADKKKRLDIIDELIKRKLEKEKYETRFSAESELVETEDTKNKKNKLKYPDLGKIMNKIRNDHSYDLNALESISDLEEKNRVREQLYCCMYGGSSLPEPKKCLERLDLEKLKSFNQKAIHNAAYGTDKTNPIDTQYLFDTIGSLVGQTYSEEGKSFGDAIGKAFVTILQDTDMNAAENIRTLLKDLFALEKLKSKFWSSVVTNENKKKHVQILDGIVEALKHFEGEPGELLNTVGVSPDLGVTSGRVLLSKAKRYVFESWQSIKLPVFLTIAFILYKSFKDEASFGWRMIKKVMPKKTYDGIRESLQELTLLFNIYGKAALVQMEPHDVGLMHYLIDKLEQQEELIPMKYRESFMNNIRLLQSSDLSAKQKYNIVSDAIFNRYPFLRDPLAIVG